MKISHDNVTYFHARRCRIGLEILPATHCYLWPFPKWSNSTAGAVAAQENREREAGWAPHQPAAITEADLKAASVAASPGTALAQALSAARAVRPIRSSGSVAQGLSPSPGQLLPRTQGLPSGGTGGPTTDPRSSSDNPRLALPPLPHQVRPSL